jgi:hypothetical protein
LQKSYSLRIIRKYQKENLKLPRPNWVVNNEVVSEKNSGGKSFMEKLKQ